jgi:hypothetical protein
MRTPGAFGADDRKVKTTSSRQRAVARTVTAVSSMVVDGGLLRLVPPDELPHGTVGGGFAEVVGATVDDEVKDVDEEEVDDVRDVVVVLAFPLPLWHDAPASRASTTRPTTPLIRPRTGTCSRHCRRNMRQ